MVATLLFSVTVDGILLTCGLDGRRHVVEVEGVTYGAVPELVQALAPLSGASVELCKAVNFLLKGLKYEMIGDIREYQIYYRDRVAQEETTFFTAGPRLRDFGVYDVAVMHPPCFEEADLIFFVKQSKTEVPYQVTVNTGTGQARYALLPEV